MFSHYYQIRDDYINLTDEKYWALKGYCEDLDDYNINYCLVLMKKKDILVSNKIINMIIIKEEGYKNKICKILNDNGIFKKIQYSLIELKKSINQICDFNAIFEMFEK